MVAHAWLRMISLKSNQCFAHLTFSINYNDPYIQRVVGLSQQCCEVLSATDPFWDEQNRTKKDNETKDTRMMGTELDKNPRHF